MPGAARRQTGFGLGAAYRNRTDDLRITRVFPCVARGLATRVYVGGYTVPLVVIIGC
jgi:hypothetical protein